jgi:serine protease inhibitor
LLPGFVADSERRFAAVSRTLDFASPEAPSIIDRWVSESTAGTIDAIAPRPIPDDAMAYLVSAIHFKGEWAARFDPAVTRPSPFRPDRGAPREVPMMERFGSWSYAERDGLQIVRMPYGDGGFSMCVVLPRPGAIDALIEELDEARWTTLVSSLATTDGIVALPRFRLESRIDLRDALVALGMRRAFESGADFSGMTDRNLAITHVLHKSSVEVDERGTEAAAATSAEMSDISDEPGFELRADRPFLFAIRHEPTGALLFLGVIRSLPE